MFQLRFNLFETVSLNQLNKVWISAYSSVIVTPSIFSFQFETIYEGIKLMLSRY